jgi:protein phosphatase
MNKARAPYDRRSETGPFDVVGDVHGCADELDELLAALGYDRARLTHDAGRRLVFVGDLVNRGPKTREVLRLVMPAVADGRVFAVAGNHDDMLARWLAGARVEETAGLRKSITQLAGETDAFRREVQDFLDALPDYCWLDGGRLVVAHAGMEEAMIGQDSAAIRDFAVQGKTGGDWAADYQGAAAVVYGHTPSEAAEWFNNTICLDTGCVAGGRLTALRWPERELVSVKAAAVYSKPSRPFLKPRALRAAE